MSEVKPDITVIDVNGMGFAAMYQPALAKLQHNGFATGGLLGSINSVLAHINKRPGTVPVVVWDSRAQWRYDLYPEYKGTRADKPEKIAIRDSYKKQTPYVREMLMALGIPQISCGGAEADDIGGKICRDVDDSWIVEMCSKDTDWYQGIKKNTYWYSPLSEMVVDLDTFTNPEKGLDDGHFVSTHEYLQAKALAGDDSDNIKGIWKVGIKTAVSKMRAHGGTIEGFWQAIDSGEYTPKGVIEERMATQESRDLYARNIRLMDWSLSPAINLEGMALMSGKPDWKLAQGIADEFGLKKVMKVAREVLAPWEESGWGEGLLAIDSALHSEWVQPRIKAGSQSSFV